MFNVQTSTGYQNKVGNMFRSTTEEPSCPSDCPLKGKGCYAEVGPQGWQWKKVTNGVAKNLTNWDGFCQKVKRLPKATMWRHNVAGDLPHVNGEIAEAPLSALVRANKGKHGFTYTHHALSPENLAVIKSANDNGFTINLSANGLHQVDEYVNTRLPVVTVLPMDSPKVQRTPNGNKVVVCPAVNSEKVHCDTCGICADPKRGYTIGFPAHGARKRKATEVAQGIL
jgi:hypothetical protein